MPEHSTSLLFRHPSPHVRRRDLLRFLKDLAQEILPGRGVTCLIATDEEMSALNRKFRGKNYPTDVLSFPAARTGPVRPRKLATRLIGLAGPSSVVRANSGDDIAISFDRAAAQAAELGHSVEDELRILMLHGLLHLAGMDHHADYGAMARAELRWRRQLGLPAGLIERAKASA
jgi:probable rRNA maturation factor